MEVIFKYNHELPDFLYEITDSMIGYSKLDDKPIYKIKFDINEKLVNDILFNSNDRLNYMENVMLFLRKEKTNKLLHHINDSEMEKFLSFVQYYYDHILDLVVLQQN